MVFEKFSILIKTVTDDINFILSVLHNHRISYRVYDIGVFIRKSDYQKYKKVLAERGIK